MDDLFQHYQKALENYSETLILHGPDCQLSFRQLDNWARSLGPIFSGFDSVILYLNPAGAFFASVVAGMLTGVPVTLLDPDNPVPDNLKQPEALVLTSKFLAQRAQAEFPFHSLHLLDVHPPTEPPPALTMKPSNQPVLHRLVTSGSSGQASLVTIGRAAVFLHFQEMNLHYHYQPHTLNANLTRHTSAAGINGFWRVLLAGAGLLFVDLKQESLDALYQRLNNKAVVSLQGIAPLLEALAQSAPAGAYLNHLRRIILGGQSLSPTQLSKIAVILPEDCDFSFNYSSSETLQIAAYSAPLKTVLQRPVIPCGHPLPSREVRVLGANQEVLGRGETGEIVVVAEQLALDIQSTTAAERFYRDPTDPKRQVYHTRDLGRWNAQGELEYLGRIDRQIKSRGVRIDPVLIEQALEAMPEIETAVVLGLEAREQVYLVACLVALQPWESQDLFQRLTQSFPSAWMPQFWLPFDSLPLQSSGKIDYARLKQAAQKRLEQDQTLNRPQPVEGLEEHLRQIWSEVLGYAIGEENPHFMLVGGDSLKANQLMGRLSYLGYGQLNGLWVAQYPTLKSQIQALQNTLPALAQTPSAQRANLPQPHELEKIRQYIGWV